MNCSRYRDIMLRISRRGAIYIKYACPKPARKVDFMTIKSLNGTMHPAEAQGQDFWLHKRNLSYCRWPDGRRVHTCGLLVGNSSSMRSKVAMPASERGGTRPGCSSRSFCHTATQPASVTDRSNLCRWKVQMTSVDISHMKVRWQSS